MKNRLVQALLLVFALTLSNNAQSYFGTASQGIGLRTYINSSRGLGMGNTGIASFDSLSLENYAISQWRNTPNTRASISVDYQQINATIDGTEAFYSTASLGGVNVVIPFQKSGWLIGASFSPYTNLDFKTNQQVTSNGVTFTQINILNGNINRAQLSLIWSTPVNLGIAVSSNFYFGTIKDRYDFPFGADLTEFISSTYTVQNTIFGAGLGISADYAPLEERLLLSGFVDFSPGLDVETEYPDAIIDPENRVPALSSLPLQYGLGAAWKALPRLSIAADYAYQNWTETLDNGNSFYDDWSHYGIGLERTASLKRNRAFFQKLDLRAGFSVNKLGYLFNNEPVMEYSGSVGLGVPFGIFRNNRLDFALVGGKRGDNTKNLASERFINLHVSVSMGETWFLRGR